MAEIAENVGITRQGVRDVIVRAEAILNEMEEKTGIVARFLQVRDGLAVIEENAEKIAALNRRKLDDPQLAELVQNIRDTVAELKE